MWGCPAPQRVCVLQAAYVHARARNDTDVHRSISFLHSCALTASNTVTQREGSCSELAIAITGLDSRSNRRKSTGMRSVHHATSALSLCR